MDALRKTALHHIFLFIVILLRVPDAQAGRYIVHNGAELQSIFDATSEGDTVLLREGTFFATPWKMVDSLCGNCEDPRTTVFATTGFRIIGKSLTVVGAGVNKTKLVTHAGYGIWIENSPNTYITNLAITGGLRDKDGNATDGAIVVRRSRVTINNVSILDNAHRDTSVVVGIGGIIGREGAELFIRNCLISNNGWDGIALYRGASADISDCVIKDGRGAGIGVTWDATCVAYRNEVTGYWKGIGAFGTSWVSANNNLVHHNRGWGIIATGDSYMDIANNVIFSNGNCGMAMWGAGSHGRMINNIVIKNGQVDQWVCPCVGVWNYGDWAKWEFTNNIVWENKDGEYGDIWDHTDIDGNLSVDPMFVDTISFALSPESPAIDAGSEKVNDPDGSRSDLGIYGGPKSKRKK